MYQVGDIFIDEYPIEAAEWCNEQGIAHIEEIDSVEGHRRFQIVANTADEETPEQIIERYSQAIQIALDAFAQTRKYDGIMSACSYAESTDPIFAAEAAYCIQLRDTTWRQAYNIMDEVLAGTRPLMTIEELIAELPIGSAVWPEVQA